MTLIFIIFTNHPRITAEVLNLVVSHTFSFKGTPILRRWSNDQGVIHGPWTNGLRSNDLQLRSRQDEFGVSTAAGYHVRRTARLRVDWERLRLSWRGPNTSRSGEMGIWSVATYSFTMPWYHGLPVGGGQKLLNIGAFPNVIYPDIWLQNSYMNPIVNHGFGRDVFDEYHTAVDGASYLPPPLT
jgi:hypothetical protein